MTSSREESVPNPNGIKAALVLATDLIGKALTFAEVGLDFLGVTEYVTDDRIYLG